MRQFNFFSLLYLATATVFAVIGFAYRSNVDAWLTAGFALTCAVCSLFPWWRQLIVKAGRRNSLIADVLSIAIASAIQLYGLISGSFGFIYFLVGFVIVTLISVVEDAAVLKAAERSDASPSSAQ